MKKIITACFISSLFFGIFAFAKDGNFNPQKEFRAKCAVCHGADGMKAPPGGTETQLIGAMQKDYIYHKLIDYVHDRGGTPGNNIIMFAVMDRYKFTREEIEKLAEYVSTLAFH